MLLSSEPHILQRRQVNPERESGFPKQNEQRCSKRDAVLGLHTPLLCIPEISWRGHCPLLFVPSYR
jgi:hypothetical protein